MESPTLSINFQAFKHLRMNGGMQGEENDSILRFNLNWIEIITPLGSPQPYMNRFNDVVRNLPPVPHPDQNHIIAGVLRIEYHAFKGQIAGNLGFEPVWFYKFNANHCSLTLPIDTLAKFPPILAVYFLHKLKIMFNNPKVPLFMGSVLTIMVVPEGEMAPAGVH
jgi:hypothetical protein